jgi:hypothetical protein
MVELSISLDWHLDYPFNKMPQKDHQPIFLKVFSGLYIKY